MKGRVGILAPAESKARNLKGAEHPPQSSNSWPSRFSLKNGLGVREVEPKAQPHLVIPGDAKMCRHRGCLPPTPAQVVA